MSVLDIGDLPPELTAHPLALVALVGLDVANNAVHRAIWDSFNANRSDRTSLNLKLIPEDYSFPIAKPKRTSYDWYVPKGILKTNWMKKHISEVPSVAIQFVELDWDTPVWVEKRNECTAKLQSLRASLQGRSTRVALVLIQKRAALPGTDDQLASERAAFLCSTCDLSGKTLFVLPHLDHLFGYTLRLQNAFSELAQTYYHHESRRIKNHRDHLNKTTHQLLFVRHQFKIAFFNEMKLDTGTALKNYKQAYANLMEVRATDANMLEIKTIAGFINYKMCRLSFMSGAPLDAIAQFRKHIDIFKSKFGCPELTFEHSAWMSKQFSHFGDLFEEAIQQGLNAIQTQHPGFYYQQAANHAMTRKSICLKLCKDIPESTDTQVLDGADSLEFYGQRPWRPCCQSLEPPDHQKELEGIHALKHNEINTVDQSMTIIPLLSSAVSQFKKYKCLRMKRQLTVEMGEEYYHYKDYEKALTLLKHVLWDYRVEKWRPIVSNILWTALKCAFLSANVQEYINFGLESISYWMLRTSEEKCTIQQSIANLFQGNLPGYFPTLSVQESKETEKLWSDNLAAMTHPTMFSLHMAPIIPFIECKAGFESPQYLVDQKVTVKVYIRMNCPQPMTFTKLTVLFSNPYYNKFCEVPAVSQTDYEGNLSDISTCKINLVPRNVHTYRFNFNPDANDIGNNVQITSIALQLGNENSLCTALQWIITNGSSTTNSPLQFVTKAASFSDEPSFQHIVSQISANILPRNAKIAMTISHESPVLIDEFYVFVIEIVNEEANCIRDVVLSVGLKPGQPQLIHESTHISENTTFTTKFVQFLPQLELNNLDSGEKITKKVYLKANAVGLRNILFEVNYSVDIESGEHVLPCFCKKMEEIDIDVVEPFEFSVKVLNMKCQEQVNVRTEEPFLLKLDVISISPIPVLLESACIELGKNVYPVDTVTSVIDNLPLVSQEAGTECFCLVTKNECPPSAALGIYHLKWKRQSTLDDFVIVETLVNLSAVDVVKTPIYLELDHPAHGWVCTPMTITYSLHNRLTTVQDVEIMVDSSDAFMFAGNKQMHFRILPRDQYKLMYNLYPLVSGCVPLPKLRMTLNPHTSSALSVDELICEMVPTHIFVMPQGKGNGK